MGKHLKRQLALRLSEDAHEILDRLAVDGRTKTAVLEDALRAMEGGLAGSPAPSALTDDALLAELARRVRR